MCQSQNQIWLNAICTWIFATAHTHSLWTTERMVCGCRSYEYLPKMFRFFFSFLHFDLFMERWPLDGKLKPRNVSEIFNEVTETFPLNENAGLNKCTHVDNRAWERTRLSEMAFRTRLLGTFASIYFSILNLASDRGFRQSWNEFSSVRRRRRRPRPWYRISEIKLSYKWYPKLHLLHYHSSRIDIHQTTHTCLRLWACVCVCLTVNSIAGETVRLLCWIRLTLDGWTDARKRINIWFGSLFQIQWSNAHRAQPIHSLIEFRCGKSLHRQPSPPSMTDCRLLQNPRWLRCQTILRGRNAMQ